MEDKLYSPLNFYLRSITAEFNGEYDDQGYWRDELSHEDAFTNMAEIEGFLADDRKTYSSTRGLMEYYGEGPVNNKVRSLVPHVELHGNQLWMVAHLQVEEALAPLEMADLKSWWGGQLSDGWGEGLEQRDIAVVEGALYIEPWTSSAAFFIATQAEFDRRMGTERLSDAHSAPSQYSDGFPDMDAQRRELFARLDSNLSDYCMGLLGTDEDELIGMSEEIATHFSVRDYLKADHKFDAEQLNFLLSLENPLEVVAQHTPPPKMLLNMASALDNLIAIKDALDDPQRRPYYMPISAVTQAVQTNASRDELLADIAKRHCGFDTLETRKSDGLDFREVSVWGMKTALETAFRAGQEHQRQESQGRGTYDQGFPADIKKGPSSREMLTERVNHNRDDLLAALHNRMAIPELSQEDFINLAEQVSIVNTCHGYLTSGQVMVNHVDTLLQFENPLDVLAFRMIHNEKDFADESSLIWDIHEEREFAQEGSILPEIMVTPEPPTQGKRSLLADMRQAQARIAENDDGREKEKAHNNMAGPEL